MYLVKRWDAVIVDRSLVAGAAKRLAKAESLRQQGQRIDVTEYSDTRPETTVAMYMNGIEL